MLILAVIVIGVVLFLWYGKQETIKLLGKDLSRQDASSGAVTLRMKGYTKSEAFMIVSRNAHLLGPSKVNKLNQFIEITYSN